MKYLMQMLIVIVFCFGLVVTVEESYQEDIKAVVSTVMNKTESIEKSEKKLYVSGENIQLAKYEPLDGCYLGAYVLANSNINYDMSEFERLTGIEHTIYNYNIKVGKEFPQTWVLECIAGMKVPCISIYPSEEFYIFSDEVVEKMAKDFSKFNVPMFINFYPDPEKYGVEAEEYKEFYKKVREIFDIYVPNAAFVWSVDYKNVYTSELYYPKECDWVGIDLYEDFESEIADENLDIFYNEYKFEKPIMITQLGISHYSEENHSYYTNEAKNKIIEFYENVEEKYSRIKAVNYMDINLENRYKITESSELLEGYKLVADKEYFKKFPQKEENKLYVKSNLDIYEYKDELYISKENFQKEFGVNLSWKKGLEIGKDNWYPLENVNKYTKYSIIIR